MTRRNVLLAVLFLVSVGYGFVFGQDVTIVAPTSEAAQGLDLQAVSELFKDSNNLEEFEKALNDPDIGINNLDLDDDGQVDFIRVVEDVADDTHVIVLQVPLGENEFQDVATIEVEKAADDNYNMQVHGNSVIYGNDYYLAPTVVRIHAWPIIPWMFRPVYHPYRSVFRIGFYPHWYRPYHPVTIHTYRTRTVKLTSRKTFTVIRTSRVKSVTKVNYKPRSSTLVKKRTHVSRTRTSKGKTTTVKAGVRRTTNKRTGKTTVTKGVKKTTRTGKKTKSGAGKRRVKRK
ncbi:MAG: hypothetical protein GWP06_02545 [Actinobacteria bacterium]|nr:hypothetical protein [Actinomycetota bacterium]